MRVKILKKTSNELKLEVEEAGHAFCNLLQKRLLEDESVELAGYNIPHPLAPISIVQVRTKEGSKPEDALKRATKRAHEINKEFTKELRKALRN